MLDLIFQAWPAAAADPVRSHIEAAAARFDLPAGLIAEVIHVESNGRVDAVSHAGAMGLMQLMPATWSDLRDDLRLGSDPFDPHDNVVAGAAYLRQLRDRYGSPGFLAAYNAGPGRYEQSLSGRPLPAETRRYVARLRVRSSPARDRRGARRAFSRHHGQETSAGMRSASRRRIARSRTCSSFAVSPGHDGGCAVWSSRFGNRSARQRRQAKPYASGRCTSVRC